MNEKLNNSMSLANPDTPNLHLKQKLGIGLGIIGLFILFLAFLNINFPDQGWILILAIVLSVIA